MGITLVINPGSTSKKYALYKGEELLIDSRYEHTCDGFGVCRTIGQAPEVCEDASEHVFETALEHFLHELVTQSLLPAGGNLITDVGIRIVAPGTAFAQHTRLTAAYLSELATMTPFVALHIPRMISEAQAAERLLPHARIWAVSDSAFHQSIPAVHRLIALSRDDLQATDIQRFGYHGLSVASLTRRASRVVGTMPERMVACHVGGGCSVTAVKAGVSFDTTMGYSPASGVIMGSRIGSCDADAILALMKAKGITDPDVMLQYINTETGLAGIAGSADFRILLDRYAQQEPTAVAALDVFSHQMRRAIAAHRATMNGLDIIILTGTAVVRSSTLRSYIFRDCEAGLHVKLDTEKNDSLIGQEGIISSADSPVLVAVVKNDEMGEIARVVNHEVAHL